MAALHSGNTTWPIRNTLLGVRYEPGVPSHPFLMGAITDGITYEHLDAPHLPTYQPTNLPPSPPYCDKHPTESLHGKSRAALIWFNGFLPFTKTPICPLTWSNGLFSLFKNTNFVWYNGFLSKTEISSHLKPNLAKGSYSGEEIATESQQWHLGSKLPSAQFHAPCCPDQLLLDLAPAQPISVIQLTGWCQPAAPPTSNGALPVSPLQK